jgi:carbonic anhydrase/acetyltransferase-like protein (isoleucine patch superfamily)
MSMHRPPEKPTEPLVLSYGGTWPQFASAPGVCGEGVSIIGKVEIGADPWFGWSAVLRGDGHFIRVGDAFRIGAQSTVHISEGRYPTVVGDRVSVGRDCVVHACTVGHDCVIEDGVVILDGSVLEDGVLVEAGSAVFPRSSLKGGFVYAGVPAKPVRALEPGERDRRAVALHEALAASLLSVPAFSAGAAQISSGDGSYVSENVRVAGVVRMGTQASVYFGCRLDAAGHAIDIADRSNIQDNSRIDARDGDVVLGANSTVGHNVRINSSRIGERCLVGMGAELAPGTVVEDDVLIAAGATTEPGQRLESGWIWGGRPARPIARFGESKQAGLQIAVNHYCVYSAAYRRDRGDDG